MDAYHVDHSIPDYDVRGSLKSKEKRLLDEEEAIRRRLLGLKHT
jgi:hypothetical protein